MRAKSVLFLVVIALATTTLALAGNVGINSPTNEPPPAGAILDLNGTPIPGGGDGVTFQQYFVNFTANLSSTAITFAFRDDPAFILFEEASVVDVTHSSGNLLLNGDFSGGVYLDNGNAFTPVDWTYANQYGAGAGGVVSSSCGGPQSQGYCWYDGAIQAYDAISQTIATNLGDTYQISFYVAENSNCSTDNGPPCNFSDLSTNGDDTGTGGNGIDVLAYAQAGLPPPSPEPSSFLLLGTAAAFLTLKLRKKLVS